MKADRERLRIFLERESLMKSLQESKERFRNLIETTSDWIWEIDRDGRYTYSSPRVKDMLGYRPEEILHKTLMDIAVPHQAEESSMTYEKLLQARKAFQRPGEHLSGQERPGRGA